MNFPENVTFPPQMPPKHLKNVGRRLCFWKRAYFSDFKLKMRNFTKFNEFSILRKNSIFSVMSAPATSGPQELPSRPCYAHIREVLNNVFSCFPQKIFYEFYYFYKK